MQQSIYIFFTTLFCFDQDQSIFSIANTSTLLILWKKYQQSMTGGKTRKYSFYYKQFEDSSEIIAVTKTSTAKPARTLTFINLSPIIIEPTPSSFALSNKDTVHRSVCYFAGEVLDTEDDYKLYLTQTVELLLSKKIQRTRLLFRYDPLQPKTNIHQYVDNTANFILLVKTEQGYHLAAFSQAALSSKNITEGRAFIMSLTNRKYYTVYEGKKGVKYDNHYLIFGNNELTVQAKERKVFSNFGINNGCFDPKKEGVGVILGQGKQRETMAQMYEVHEILFK